MAGVQHPESYLRRRVPGPGLPLSLVLVLAVAVGATWVGLRRLGEVPPSKVAGPLEKEGEAPRDVDGGAGLSAEAPEPATLRGRTAPESGRDTGRPRGAEDREVATDVPVEEEVETDSALPYRLDGFDQDGREEGPSSQSLPVTEPLARVGTPARWMDDEPIYGISFTPDARRVVSAGESSVIVVREVATGRVADRFQGHGTGGVSDVEVSPDGRRVISGGYDHTTRVWDLATGEILRQIEAGSGTVYHASFVRGGSLALAAGDLGAVLLWDPATGEVLRRFAFPDTGNGACLTPDGRTLVAVSSEGLIRAWDAATGSERWETSDGGGALGEVYPVPGADELVTCGQDGKLKVWAVSDGSLVREWQAHSERISEIAVAPNGGTLASGGWGGDVKHWDLSDGTLLWARDAHDDLVVAMAFTKDGRTIASGARDGATRLWDARTGEPLPGELSDDEGHSGAVTDLVFAGNALVSAGLDGTIRVWDPVALVWTKLVTMPGGAAVSLDADPRSHLVLAGGEGSLALLDPSLGTWLWTATPASTRPGVVAFDPGGARAYFIERGTGKLAIHDAATGAEDGTATGEFSALALSPSGALVAVRSGASAIELLTPFGRHERSITLGTPTLGSALAWFPDEGSLLVGTRSGAARVALADGSVLASYRADAQALDAAVTPDGAGVVLALRGGEIAYFEAASGTPRRRFQGHKGDASCVAVGPNGYRAASGGQDGAIYVWDLAD